MAPGYIALMINETLKGLDFYFAYLDDIIIYSRTGKEHLDHIKQIFDRLWKNLTKTNSDFFKLQIHHHGHLISQRSVPWLPEKLDTIK